MKRITLSLGEILDFIEELRKSGKNEKEIREMAVYLGNDEELNGIHSGYTITEATEKDVDWDFISSEVNNDDLKYGIVVIS